MGWDLSRESQDVLPSSLGARHWLTAYYGRRHLNCLIMDMGYDSLSHQERNSRWVAWAKVKLLYHLSFSNVCVCVCVCAAPVKQAYHSYISCSWLLCSTLLTSGIPERICSEGFKRVACQMSNGWEFRAWNPSDISFQNWAGVPSYHLCYVTFWQQKSGFKNDVLGVQGGKQQDLNTAEDVFSKRFLRKVHNIWIWTS